MPVISITAVLTAVMVSKYAIVSTNVRDGKERVQLILCVTPSAQSVSLAVYMAYISVCHN